MPFNAIDAGQVRLAHASKPLVFTMQNLGLSKGSIAFTSKDLWQTTMLSALCMLPFWLYGHHAWTMVCPEYV